MRWFKKGWPYALLVLLLSANLAIVWQRQWIGDWLRLRDYTAPANIVALADDTAMTDAAQKLFYINHPVLEDKEAFNAHCSDLDEETAVLGCYHGDRLGIYLYDVEDQRLHGVKEVTAAHEMLHQAYDRLSDTERQTVSRQLESLYKSGTLDPDIIVKIDSYKKQKDIVIANEMHSIFGSEVRNLPAGLEAYYKRYFNDRTKVVTFSEAYQGEFKRRKQLVKDYDSQLSSLKTQIDGNKADLERRSRTLQAKEEEINQDVVTQDPNEYRADVQQYNAMVEAYNAKITSTRKLIDEYNATVAARNEIAVEEQELQKALDSRLAPAETQ